MQYKDLNFKMEIAGSNEFKEGQQAVINSVMFILFTLRRQIPMQPGKGSYLYKLLFEPVSDTTSNSIKQEIYATINDPNNELLGLVSVGFSDIVVTVDIGNNYRIALNLTMKTLNNVQVLTNFTVSPGTP